MGMYALVEVCNNEEIFVNWFSDLQEAKSALAQEFNSAYKVISGEISDDGMSGCLSARYRDSMWEIVEIPVSTHLCYEFDKFKQMTGWRGLDAENAIESFIRFVGKEV